MRKADVTENGVNGNKLTFYKAAVPQRNVENRGVGVLFYMVCTENKNSIFPASGVLPVRTEKGNGEKMNLYLIGTSEYKCLQGSTEQEVFFCCI